MGKRTGAPVELPEQIAERLGLGARATAVRPLSRGSRTLLLERVEGEGTPLPWDRDLVLSVDVRGFPLASVMQMIHAAGKSGFLLLENDRCAKGVYFHAGEVVFAASDQVIDRLGNSLVRSGVIDLEVQRHAASAYSPPGQFGRFLIERGVLTPRELWDGVKAQVEEIVRSLFALDAGYVYFWEGEVRPDNVVRLALPTGRLIEEGLWHRDELLVYLAQLEDPRARIRVQGSVDAELNGAPAEILRTAAREERFPALCQAVGLDPLTAANSIRMLETMGALRVVRQASEAPAADPEAELRECVARHAKLLDELLAPVVAADGPERVRERIAGIVEDAAARHAELLGDLPLAPGGSVDPELVIARARAFPGDREHEVRAALGELIAYAEFELLNHPGVRSPESFLADLEPLRAAL